MHKFVDGDWSELLIYWYAGARLYSGRRRFDLRRKRRRNGMRRQILRRRFSMCTFYFRLSWRSECEMCGLSWWTTMLVGLPFRSIAKNLFVRSITRNSPVYEGVKGDRTRSYRVRKRVHRLRDWVEYTCVDLNHDVKGLGSISPLHESSQEFCDYTYVRQGLGRKSRLANVTPDASADEKLTSKFIDVRKSKWIISIAAVTGCWHQTELWMQF